MSPTSWTDDRHDDFARGVDRQFDLVHQDIRGLRADMTTGFAAVRGEMATEFAAVRAEMASGFAEVRGEIATLNGRVVTILLALCVALVGAVSGLVAVSL